MAEHMKKSAFDFIDSKEDLLRTIGLELWKNPEIGLQEVFAHKLLTETLSNEGFTVTEHFVVETGFKAEYQTAARPHIVIICEYDALPNIGHACGHNLIAESGIGASLGLKHAMETKGLQCRLTVLGTPAEENFGAKITMIQHGVFKDVDVALMVHPREINSLHMPHYALREFEVTFIGRSAHATGSPWEGKNALDAATLAYQGIAFFRKQMKPNWHINANLRLDQNSFLGIIPEKVMMEADVRCGNMSDLKGLFRRLEQIIKGAAMMADCEVTIDPYDEVYASLVSNKTVLKHYKDNARYFDIKIEDISRSGGSTDMGNVSMEVPSIHPVFYIGCPEGPHTAIFAEYAGTEGAHRQTLVQCKMLAATAIDLASDSAILKKAKNEFECRKKEGFPEESYRDLY